MSSVTGTLRPLMSICIRDSLHSETICLHPTPLGGSYVSALHGCLKRTIRLVGAPLSGDSHVRGVGGSHPLSGPQALEDPRVPGDRADQDRAWRYLGSGKHDAVAQLGVLAHARAVSQH